MACLELEYIKFSYGREESIKGFSLSVEERGFIGLIGPNGAGKSTILKLACGILKPAEGRVKLFGNDLRNYRPGERAKLISYLPQTLETNIPFTVREIVDMGLYTHNALNGMSPDEAMEAAGLLEKSALPIAELSAGERKRAFIAMFLVQGSRVLLLDEPLANLDFKYQISLIRLLKEITDRRGISLVMASHDINTVFCFERVCVVKEGRMFAQGSPEKTATKGLFKEVFEVDWENFPVVVEPEKPFL